MALALAFPATSPPGSSSEGVNQGRCGGVLANYDDQPRKKLTSKLVDYILVFCIYLLLHAPNTMVLHRSCASCLWPCLLSFLNSTMSTSFWLIVVCTIVAWQPSKANAHFIFGFFSIINATVKTIRQHQHPPTRSHHLSPPL